MAAGMGWAEFAQLANKFMTDAANRKRQGEMAGATADAYDASAQATGDLNAQTSDALRGAQLSALPALQNMNRGTAAVMGDDSYLMDLESLANGVPGTGSTGTRIRGSQKAPPLRGHYKSPSQR